MWEERWQQLKVPGFYGMAGRIYGGLSARLQYLQWWRYCSLAPSHPYIRPATPCELVIFYNICRSISYAERNWHQSTRKRHSALAIGKCINTHITFIMKCINIHITFIISMSYCRINPVIIFNWYLLDLWGKSWYVWDLMVQCWQNHINYPICND